MIPLFQKTADSRSCPSRGTHYRLAHNGLFLVQDTPLFLATTRVVQGRDLQSETTSLHLRFLRVPSKLLEEAYGFFLEVYLRHRGEALVFILYVPDTAEFSLAVPRQQLTEYKTGGGTRTTLGVRYETLPRSPGTMLLGDIHSHVHHSAGFSPADDLDDVQRDGLHVVFGHLHQEQPDLRVSFVTNRTRFVLAPFDCLETFTVPRRPPQEWLDQVAITSISEPALSPLPVLPQKDEGCQ